MLRIVIIIVMAIYYSDAIARLYFFQFIIYPLEYCQIISLSVTYGVYKKEVRKKLRKYYQRLQRLLPLRPSKVITLNPH